MLSLNSFEWSIAHRSSSSSDGSIKFYPIASRCFINARTVRRTSDRHNFAAQIPLLFVYSIFPRPGHVTFPLMLHYPISIFFVVSISHQLILFRLPPAKALCSNGRSEPNGSDADYSFSHFLRLKNHHQFSACRMCVCVRARARRFQHNMYERTELARSVIVIQNTQKRLVPHTTHLNDLLHQSFDKSKHIIDKMRPKIRIQLTGEYFKWKTKRAVTMVRMPLDMANYKITNDGIVHYKHVTLHPTPLSSLDATHSHVRAVD